LASGLDSTLRRKFPSSFEPRRPRRPRREDSIWPAFALFALFAVTHAADFGRAILAALCYRRRPRSGRSSSTSRRCGSAGFRGLATGPVRLCLPRRHRCGDCIAWHESRLYPSAARACRALSCHHPARLGARQDAHGAERCAVRVGPSLDCSRLHPIAPASVGRDDRTADREIHIAVTVPSAHPGRRAARPADRTSPPLPRLLRCRQRRALRAKNSARAGPQAFCRPSPRRSPW
jgi:hypothetical protein